MYLCLCHAVTDRQVRQAVQEGTSSLRQVQLSLRLGTKCGKCIPAARELVHACQRESGCPPSPTTAPRLRVVSRR